ncbi:Hypothetical protein c0852 [Escherichia coli CFT073]|uniref:Uncharacterized protein n=1 Tax=Escherichia coli O6:H1 (strain CFT073 / ATCC 700928 / UPEC) TaxID=199310 RepID=A0A0H2V633_ECOL6|nr:Hypothetical protein c0852 [Escherichia coli CFT073]
MFKRAGSELSHLFVPFAFESRICSSSGKEVSKGGLLVAQRLLEGNAGNIIQPYVFRLFFERRKASVGL